MGISYLNKGRVIKAQKGEHTKERKRSFIASTEATEPRMVIVNGKSYDEYADPKQDPNNWEETWMGLGPSRYIGDDIAVNSGAGMLEFVGPGAFRKGAGLLKGGNYVTRIINGVMGRNKGAKVVGMRPIKFKGGELANRFPKNPIRKTIMNPETGEMITMERVGKTGAEHEWMQLPTYGTPAEDAYLYRSSVDMGGKGVQYTPKDQFWRTTINEHNYRKGGILYKK